MTSNKMLLLSDKVPKLRFPEFEGEWEEKKISEATDYVDYRGKTPTKVDAGIFLVTAKNIKKGYIDYAASAEYIAEKEYADVMARGRPQIGDVLITTEAPCGNVAQVDKPYIALAQRVIKYRGKVDLLNNTFLKYLLLSEIFQARLEQISTGGTVKGVKGSTLHKEKINIPSLPEQQKIASFLSSVDAWIENLRAQKEALETYKKGMMQKIFSREVRFRGENGEEFPKWEEKRLGEVAEIIGGGTPDTTIEEYWNGSINWFTPTEIKQKYVKDSLRKISDAGLKNSSAKLLPAGTLLFTSRATVGDIAISLEESTTNQGFQSLIVNNKNSKEFVYYWILINKKEFLKRANGSTFLEISGGEMRNMKSFFPSLQEQQKIADFLQSCDTLIEEKDEQIHSAEEWKKGVMQRVFV